MFGTVSGTMVKTYAMMTSGFEFDDIFHDPSSGSVLYPDVSYILIVIFLTGMNIIIMNLLVRFVIVIIHKTVNL